jgi:enamine deaminase RidA (YjgF/YER057c/UK114 family)
MTAQTVRILENLQAVLRTVGRDLGHVVKVNVFLTDMARVRYRRHQPPMLTTWDTGPEHIYALPTPQDHHRSLSTTGRAPMPAPSHTHPPRGRRRTRRMQ